ncbi:hypothetical protein VTO73DRAFT_6196 [Trametes versicolor]
MSDHHASDPLQVGEPSQSPPAHEPVTSEGELPAGAERGETNDASEVERREQTRPEMPPEVSLEDVFNKKYTVYTQEEKTKAWSGAAGMVQTYSDEMIKRWKEEIDTYLVFAGLFSAVLTTFNVQSYLLLQPATPDPSIAVLQQISSQLASFSIHPPFVNSTQPSSTTRANANTPPPVPRWAVWLNALWFSGLILSLSSASVGIMVKQWLNEYSSGVSGTSRPVARVRQYRLNNLRTWRVEDIIGAIPILLQLALALFLSGMLILLWTLHDTVAAIASTLVSLLAVFTVVTTLLPLVNPKCSYLTPQIRAFDAAWQPKRYAYWHHSIPDPLSAASVCLMDFYEREVVDYFQQLHKSAREHFGPAVDSEHGPLGDGNQQQLLWIQIILCILWWPHLRMSDDEAAALGVYFRSGSWSSSLQAADAEWAVSTCNVISDHLETKGPFSAVTFVEQTVVSRS